MIDFSGVYIAIKEKIFGVKVDMNTTVLLNVDRKRYVEAFFAAMKSLN